MWLRLRPLRTDPSWSKLAKVRRIQYCLCQTGRITCDNLSPCAQPVCSGSGIRVRSRWFIYTIHAKLQSGAKLAYCLSAPKIHIISLKIVKPLDNSHSDLNAFKSAEGYLDNKSEGSIRPKMKQPVRYEKIPPRYIKPRIRGHP